MKDAIIVLGCQINEDGTISDLLKSRVDKGIELYKKSISKRLIFTGGVSHRVESASRTEASVMKEYAIAKGVNEKDIFLEDEAQDTVGNIYFVSVKLLNPNKWKDIVVVTSNFHLKRAKFLFRFYFKYGYIMEFMGADNVLPDEEIKGKLDFEVRENARIKKLVSDLL